MILAQPATHPNTPNHRPSHSRGGSKPTKPSTNKPAHPAQRRAPTKSGGKDKNKQPTKSHKSAALTERTPAAAGAGLLSIPSLGTLPATHWRH